MTIEITLNRDIIEDTIRAVIRDSEGRIDILTVDEKERIVQKSTATIIIANSITIKK